MKRDLHLSLVFPACLTVVLLAVGVLAAFLAFDRLEASRYVPSSAVAAAVVFAVLVYYRKKNHPPDSTLVYRNLGLPNTISLVRGILLSFLLGTIVLRQGSSVAWLQTCLYTTAIVLDFLDGFAARRSGRVTVLGEHLDMEYDSLGVLFASFVVVRIGVAGPWFLLVGAARYLFVAGLSLRKRLGRPVVPLTGSLSGRVAAGLQMGYMSAAMWPIIPTAYRSVAAVVFSVFFFASFLRDWLVTSSALDRQGRIYTKTEELVSRLLGPVRIALRVATVVVFVLLAGRLEPALRAIAAVLALSVLLGMVGRIGALAVLLVWIFSTGSSAPPPLAYLFETITLLVLVLGTGPLSLASPERRWFAR